MGVAQVGRALASVAEALAAAAAVFIALWWVCAKVVVWALAQPSGLTWFSTSRPGSSRRIWVSKAGTSTKDVMARMGHDDMRAALIYQRR